ncbi:calcium-binding protein [Paracoccus shandongensis]|uniref:calcium-binding protein n=1 Tax=Paracoccus shandongensis TaxID=2816048 RepID=UPI001A8F8F12|nr:calcium-binding protein [Paracoccus shandongensis]
MFVLASLMALAAAGAALDLTSTASRDVDDDDPEDLPPTLGEPDRGEVGDISAGTSEEGGADPAPGPDVTGPPVAEENPDDELIEGGPEAEDLFGGAGNDTIEAGAGDDWVQGDGSYDAAGDDEIRGGAGADSLAGQGGDDIIWGDEGADTVYGGEGQDTLFGGSGNDWLSGNDGDDLLVSGGGADDLDGGRGNDHLVGDDDPDTVWMHGGVGADTLAPGAGDFAEGQDGADQFVLQQAPGQLPVIADFDAREDQMVLHLPDSIAGDARIDLAEDKDGTVLITVNGEAIGRMLQSGGLVARDILVVRLPG